MCSVFLTCTEPSNMRCSKRCAKPVCPAGSCREPTSYQRLTQTTGELRSSLTTTRRPFTSRVVSMGHGKPVVTTGALGDVTHPYCPVPPVVVHDRYRLADG